VDTRTSENNYHILPTACKLNKMTPKYACLKLATTLLVLLITHTILIHPGLADQSSSFREKLSYNTEKVSHELTSFMEEEKNRDQRIRVLVKFKPSLLEEEANTHSIDKNFEKKSDRNHVAQDQRRASSNLSHLHSLLGYQQNTGKSNKYNEKASWLTNSIIISLTPEEIAVLSNDTKIEKIVKKKSVIMTIPQSAVIQSTTIQGDVSVQGDSSVPTDPWHLNAIGMQGIQSQGLNGNGIRIGHLDSGISDSAQDVASKVIAWAEFNQAGEKIESALHETTTSSHGTFTASILAGDTTGVAPGAQLLSALVLPGGYGSEEQILAGLEWVIDPNGDGVLDDGAQIINMSFGMPKSSEILSEAIKKIVSLGILPVGAAGNQGVFAVYFPAIMPEVIAVGATDQLDQVIPQSSGGFLQNGEVTIIKPDITAPGYQVVGLDQNGDYQTLSGTSVAAPQIAGAAAILLQQMPEQSSDDLKNFLLYSSRKVGSQEKNIRYGMGLLNVSAASQFLDRYAARSNAVDLILKDTSMPKAFNSKLSTYYSNGSNQFLEEERFESYPFHGFNAIESRPIALADVNSDGLADLIVRQKTMIDADTSMISYIVHTMTMGSGFSTFGQTWYSSTQPKDTEPEHLGMADVNGDGREDLLIRKRQEGLINYKVFVYALLSNGWNGFDKKESPWAEFSVPVSDVLHIDFGDINGDDKVDMVYWQKRNDSYMFYPTHYYTRLSDSSRFLPSEFGMSIYYSNHITSEHLAVRDINGDGAADLIMNGFGIYGSDNTLYIQVYLSDLAGQFKAKQIWGILDWDENASIVGIEDVNDDNSADLILRRFDQASGNWTFSVAKSNNQNKLTEDVEPWLAVPGNPEAVPPEVIGVREVGLGDWIVH
jgi:hypothetical protein